MHYQVCIKNYKGGGTLQIDVNTNGSLCNRNCTLKISKVVDTLQYKKITTQHKLCNKKSSSRFCVILTQLNIFKKSILFKRFSVFYLVLHCIQSES